MDEPRVGLQLVGARDDDDLVELAARARPLEHPAEQQPLLRRSEPGRRACGEDDGSYRQPFRDRQSAITLFTYASDSVFGAPPALITAVGPALYAASIRSVAWNCRSRIFR